MSFTNSIVIAGWLHIEWDRNSGNSYHYRYGSNSRAKDKFDIMVCDEPRILDNQFIALGCLVTRGIRLLIYIQDKKQLMKFFTIDICFTFLLLNLGPDWQYGDQDGGAGNIGSVFQVAENGIVHV